MFEKLLHEAASLQPVSSAASAAYRRETQNLLHFVNSSLDSHPNIEAMTGNCFKQHLIDSQGYHARFMLTVFHFNNYPLLCRVLLWFYHVCLNRGYAPDFFPVLFSVWQRAIDRFLPPAEAAEINLKYQWLMSKNETMFRLTQQIDELQFSGNALQEKIEEPLLLACQESLLNGDYHTCLALLENSGKSAIENLYCKVLEPCLYSIGDLWELDEIDAAREHLATATASRIMQMQYAAISAQNKHSKGLAIISAAPGEYHSIGANMVSDLLELADWQTHFLGGNTPLFALLNLLREKRPFLLGLSVVMPFNLLHCEELIRLIRAEESLAHLRIIVGGPCFLLDNALWRQVGADAYANSAKEAVKIAEAWWEEENPI